MTSLLVAAVDREIKDVEKRLDMLKRARTILEEPLDKASKEFEEKENIKQLEVKPKPKRANITLQNKHIYRTEKDKRYLESVIMTALESVKKPKTAKWVYDNTRTKQGLQTFAGIDLKMKQMADKGILDLIPSKSNRGKRLFKINSNYKLVKAKSSDLEIEEKISDLEGKKKIKPLTIRAGHGVVG